MNNLIKKSMLALLLTTNQYLEKFIELDRVIKPVVILQKSGVNNNNSIFSKSAKMCLMEQKNDGGWISVEDSVWILAFLKEKSDYFTEYKNGLKWLKEQQLSDNSWGKTSRDIGRIPITGLLLYLLPELSNEKSFLWIENKWKKDFSITPKLTYKGAFCLMALKSANRQFTDKNLVDNTLKWLASQQNDDFGWGPWRGHPIGSSPYCTGVALVGLLQYPDLVDRQVIVNGLEWIRRNQLENGLWPDHYIEEGSAWCFYALTEGYKFLKGTQ